MVDIVGWFFRWSGFIRLRRVAGQPRMVLNFAHHPPGGADHLHRRLPGIHHLHLAREEDPRPADGPAGYSGRSDRPVPELRRRRSRSWSRRSSSPRRPTSWLYNVAPVLIIGDLRSDVRDLIPYSPGFYVANPELGVLLDLRSVLARALRHPASAAGPPTTSTPSSEG